MQKRLVTLLSSGIAYGLAHLIADRIVEEPEERGIQDDLKEALLKAAFSISSTLIASIVIRRYISSRWSW